MMLREKNILRIIVEEPLKTKKRIFLVYLLLLIVSCKSQNREQHELGMDVVRPKYAETGKIISDIHDKVSKIVDWDKAIFVLHTYNSKGIYIVKFAVFYKDDLGWFLRDNKEKPYGIFDYEHIPVVVIGESSDVLFTKVKEKKIFEWLKVLPPLKDDVTHIPPHFDSPTWKYEFSDGVFALKATEYWEYKK